MGNGKCLKLKKILCEIKFIYENLLTISTSFKLVQYFLSENDDTKICTQ